MIVTHVTLDTVYRSTIHIIYSRDSVVYSWCVLVCVVGNKCNKCNIYSNIKRKTVIPLNTIPLINSLGELK